MIRDMSSMSFVSFHITSQHCATFYKNNAPSSRIDQIWFSDSLYSKDFCFNRVWKLPFTYLSTSPQFQLDHTAVITYFTKSLFIRDLPLHPITQQQAWCSFFDVKHTTREQWSE